MAPERKHNPSTTFTIRLGIGSVILAALITFVGLSWIFFLGVMAGRMYYGVDQTVTQNANQSQQAPSNAIPPSVVVSNDQPSGKTESPKPHKSNSTYHPIIKEDSMAERVALGQEPFVSDGFESIQKADQQSIPAELDLEIVPEQATEAHEISTALDSQSDMAISGDEADTTTSQDIDFIENASPEPTHDLIPETSQVAPPLLTSSTPVADLSENQDTVQSEFPHTSAEQAVVKSQETPDIMDAPSAPPELSALQTEEITKDSTEKTLLPDTSINTNVEDITENQAIFDYTYQLATFKNPESAQSITNELVEAGLNAVALTEENNGTTFYYILVYHRGTQHSQKALEEILAQHHFTDFIVRSKVVQ